jgi:hypothetical protein
MTHQVEVNGMARERDVVDLLLEQHGRIETLFDQVAVARVDEKRELFLVSAPARRSRP